MKAEEFKAIEKLWRIYSDTFSNSDTSGWQDLMDKESFFDAMEEYAQSRLPKEGEEVYVKDLREQFRKEIGVHPQDEPGTYSNWLEEKLLNRTTLSLPTEEEIKKRTWNWIADHDEYAEIIADGKIDEASEMIAEFIKDLLKEKRNGD